MNGWSYVICVSVVEGNVKILQIHHMFVGS